MRESTSTSNMLSWKRRVEACIARRHIQGRCCLAGGHIPRMCFVRSHIHMQFHKHDKCRKAFECVLGEDTVFREQPPVREVYNPHALAKGKMRLTFYCSFVEKREQIFCNSCFHRKHRPASRTTIETNLCANTPV